MELQITMISSIIIALAAQAAATPASDAAKVDANTIVEVSPASEVEKKEIDPVVCERVQEVGSLIRAKKVCMRKSQWEEQRRSDRSLVERSQVQRGLTGD